MNSQVSYAKYYVALGLFSVVLFGVIGYVGYKILRDIDTSTQVVEVHELPREKNVSEDKKQLVTYIGDSLIRNQPENLKNYFTDKARNHDKTPLSKAAIYFITHRFFENGADIYEIVDYTLSDPSLKFLTNASKIYPPIFAKIVQRQTLTKDESILAYLAYQEILQVEGYNDSAGAATAAARYFELYEGVLRGLEIPGISPQTLLNKGVAFAKAAQPYVERFMRDDLTYDELSKDAVLVGLSQYGVSLAYIKKYGLQYTSTYTYNDIFKKALRFATKNKLVLEPFLALNFAYALIVTGDATKESISTIELGRRMEEGYPSLKPTPYKATDKIINSSKYGFKPYGGYGTETIQKIVSFDPLFLNYLKDRGYTTK